VTSCPKLDQLYAGIASKAPLGGYRRVVVVLYPHLFSERICGATGAIGAGRGATLNGIGDTLDAAIVAAVQRRNDPSTWVIADSRPAFHGHAICSPDGEWINGISDPIEESFHPNRDGYRGLVNVVVPAAGIDT
jgi:hypothetical protein